MFGSLGLPEFVLLAAIIGTLVWMMRGRGTKRISLGWYCQHCGSLGAPKTRVKGSFWIEVILWFCFLVPGVIYSVWRLTTKDKVCTACGALNMIPVDSPKAQAARLTLAPGEVKAS
jgi:hypothetical protein